MVQRVISASAHLPTPGEIMIHASLTAVRRLASASILIGALALGTAASAAESFVFDKGHTEIRFSWSHLGVSKMSGMILDYDGELAYDAAAPEKSTLQITAKTDSLWTHVDKLTTHLKSAEFFDTAKFPEIAFKATKIEKTGEKTGKITGDLTIKGVTKPVTFDAVLNYQGNHPMSKKPALGFSAKTTVKRSEFNIGAYVPAVPDEIQITVETEMSPKG
jgi:polyisoprenoid-binding protein YceI